MWVEFVVGSCPLLGGFSLGIPLSLFLPPQNPTFSNSNSTWKQWTNSHSVDVPLKFPFFLSFILFLPLNSRNRRQVPMWLLWQHQPQYIQKKKNLQPTKVGCFEHSQLKKHICFSFFLGYCYSVRNSLQNICFLRQWEAKKCKFLQLLDFLLIAPLINVIQMISINTIPPSGHTSCKKRKVVKDHPTFCSFFVI